MEKIAQLQQSLGMRAQVSVVPDEAPAGVRGYVEAANADLLVIGRRRAGWASEPVAHERVCDDPAVVLPRNKRISRALRTEPVLLLIVYPDLRRFQFVADPEDAAWQRA